MATRAKVGGETGLNGEFYKGGTFLPRTRLPKRGPAAGQLATRRALVKPGIWDNVPAGFTAIFPRIQSFVVFEEDKASSKYPDDHTAIAYYFNDPAELHQLIAAYNSGTLYD